MLEALMGTGKKAGTITGSGPGPQTLIGGDAQLGFFGEVTSSELFTTAELSNLTSFSGGTSIIANPVWLKFAYKDKILFIAKSALKNYVNWNTLYYAGLVYGTDDVGLSKPYPPSGPDTGTAVNQYTTVDKVAGENRWGFIVRLPQMATSNPDTIANGYNDVYLKDVEWNDLMYSVAARTALPVRVARFFNYTDAAFYNNDSSTGSYTLGKEMTSSASSSTARGSNIEVAYFAPMSASSAFFGWRPVLELIRPDKGLVPLANIRYNGGVLLPASNAVATLVGADFLWGITGQLYGYDGPITVGGFKSLLKDGLLVPGNANGAVNGAVVPVGVVWYKTDSPIFVGGITSLMKQSESLFPATGVTAVATN